MLRAANSGPDTTSGTRAEFTDSGTLIARPLKRVALALHARPDRGTNGRWPRDRGDNPPPGSGCVLEADRLGRGRTARLNVGFVFFRCMIALDGWIVSATSACSKQRGGHDQSDTQQFHAPMIGRAKSPTSPAVLTTTAAHKVSLGARLISRNMTPAKPEIGPLAREELG
jgi:hypothetical protein